MKELVKEGNFFGKEGLVSFARKTRKEVCRKDNSPEVKEQAHAHLATVYLMTYDNLVAKAKIARLPRFRRLYAKWYFFLFCRLLCWHAFRVGVKNLSFTHLMLMCEMHTRMGLPYCANRYYEHSFYLPKAVTADQEMVRRIIFAELCIAKDQIAKAKSVYRKTGDMMGDNEFREKISPEVMARFYYSGACLERTLKKKKRSLLSSHITKVAFGLGRKFSEEHGLTHYKLLFDSIHG